MFTMTSFCKFSCTYSNQPYLSCDISAKLNMFFNWSCFHELFWQNYHKTYFDPCYNQSTQINLQIHIKSHKNIQLNTCYTKYCLSVWETEFKCNKSIDLKKVEKDKKKSNKILQYRGKRTHLHLFLWTLSFREWI